MGGSKAAPEDDDAEPETPSGILGLVDAAEAAEAADGVVSAPARKPALGERAGASLSRAFTKVNKAAAGARVPCLPCLGPPRTDALNGALDVDVGRLALHVIKVKGKWPAKMEYCSIKARLVVYDGKDSKKLRRVEKAWSWAWGVTDGFDLPIRWHHNFSLREHDGTDLALELSMHRNTHNKFFSQTKLVAKGVVPLGAIVLEMHKTGLKVIEIVPLKDKEDRTTPNSLKIRLKLLPPECTSMHAALDNALDATDKIADKTGALALGPVSTATGAVTGAASLAASKLSGRSGAGDAPADSASPAEEPTSPSSDVDVDNRLEDADRSRAERE